MSSQQADAAVVCRLETRIDPRAKVVPVTSSGGVNEPNESNVQLGSDQTLISRSEAAK